MLLSPCSLRPTNCAILIALAAAQGVLRVDATAATHTATPSQNEVLTLAPVEVHPDRLVNENYKVERTRIATKIDTALQDVPQSISVITSEQMLDQRMTSLADFVRYVPGVSAHQGENNRDQIIFRGNSSSADFFVNGVRDDVQYYRDLYN